MYKFIILALMVALPLALSGTPAGAASPGPGKPAVVSPGWLAAHKNLPNLVLIDVRTAAEYAAGHIENAVNIPLEVPFSAWVTMRGDLLLELPPTNELFATLGAAGIRGDSRVVVITSFGEPPYPQANATRVADTLIYAGVRDVSVLDGGQPAWVAEGRPTTTVVPQVTPTVYTATVNDRTFVDTRYVSDRIGRSTIVDARDAEVYAGRVVEPWADKPGHIPSAVSLPAPQIWNADGTYRSEHELRSMVEAATGSRDRDGEIIVYCGVGGYASSWLFVLTEMLGYRNVRMYDGSAQEWVKDHDMEL